MNHIKDWGIPDVGSDPKNKDNQRLFTWIILFLKNVQLNLNAWFPHGLENGKTFSSQGILIRPEKSGNFALNTGKVREF